MFDFNILRVARTEKFLPVFQFLTHLTPNRTLACPFIGLKRRLKLTFPVNVTFISLRDYLRLNAIIPDHMRLF